MFFEFYPLAVYGLQLMAIPSVVAVNQSVTLFVNKVTSYVLYNGSFSQGTNFLIGRPLALAEIFLI